MHQGDNLYIYLDGNLLSMGHPCKLTTRHIMCKPVCQDIIFLDQLVISWLAHILSNMCPIILDSTIFLITLEITEGVLMVTMYCPWKFPGPQFLKPVTMSFLWQKDFSSCNWVCELGMKKVFCIIWVGGQPHLISGRWRQIDERNNMTIWHSHGFGSWLQGLWEPLEAVGGTRTCFSWARKIQSAGPGVRSVRLMVSMWNSKCRQNTSPSFYLTSL